MAAAAKPEAGEGEATNCHRRSAAGQEEEEEESKRPRDGNDEEEELLTELSRYRRYWTDLWSDDSGDIDRRSEEAFFFFSFSISRSLALGIFLDDFMVNTCQTLVEFAHSLVRF